MRTKIVCSLGPASESEEVITKLIEEGMNVARCNFSHGTHEEHRLRIELVRKIAKKLHKDVEILCDLQGPKLRIRDFSPAPRTLCDGQTVVLSASGSTETKKDEIIVEDPYLHTDIRVGDIVLIDDGQIELVVEKINSHKMTCRVINGGDVYPRKGVNVPLTKTTTSSLTDKDIKDLEFVLTQNPDWIAISFVQSEFDVIRLRELIGDSKARIMCKIERAKAIDNLASIIKEADGLMVARGDLGVEIPFEKLPFIQKKIIRYCNDAEKPVVTATQMLASMTHAPFPTRAEVTDVANAVIDGTDAVMMSNETNIGEYPVAALITMRKIVEEAEKHLYHRENKL